MVIHLSGPDTYRSQRRFQQLRDAWRDKYDVSNMGVVVLDGETMTAEDLRTATSTTGFFSPRRFIGINFYSPKNAACPGHELQEILEPYADNKDVVVIVREIGPEPNPARQSIKKKSNKPTAKELKIPGLKTERFDNLTEVAEKKWIDQEVKIRDGKISPAAIGELILRCGPDLWRVDQELDKLLALADSQPIQPDHVRQLVIAPEVSDVFALTDAIGHRQTGRALKLLQQELAAGAHPLALLSLLSNQVRNLRLVQISLAEGVAPTRVASELKLHPFVVSKAITQAKNFSPQTLQRWLNQLVAIDYTLKSSRLDAETLLDLLLIKS